MQIHHVKISNCLGIKSLEFDADKFNALEGDNAAGKTSVLKTIEAALGKGNRAELIRQGEDRGEAVIVFDTGHELTATFKPTGTVRKIKTPDDAIIQSPVEWLERKLNVSAYSPIKFLSADEDEQVAIITKASKLNLSKSDLAQACGQFESIAKYGPNHLLQNPLEVIDNVSKAIYDHRTGLNRSAKDKRGHIAELAATLPSAVPGEVPDVPELRQQLEQVRAKATSAKKSIETLIASDLLAIHSRTEKSLKLCETHREQAIAIAKIEYDKVIEEARRKLDLACEDARNQCSVESREANEVLVKAMAATETEKTNAIAAIQAEYGPKFETLKQQIGRAEALAEANAKAEATREIIRKSTLTAAALESESKAATESLSRIEALKGKILESLPVKGLEIKDGKLVYNGTPFRTLNDAQRVNVALQLAQAISGDGIIFLDGMEKVGRKLRREIVSWAEQTPAQFFVTQVVDDLPLTINGEACVTSYEQPEAAEELVAV